MDDTGPPAAGEELTREESLRLLQDKSYVGRVGFIDVDGRITVLPVNYLADDTSIVFCTAPGGKLGALAGGAAVAFEVDASRAFHHTGWSVLVRGHAREVTDPRETDLLGRGPLRSWARPAPGHWIRITIEEISGRRLPEH
jgi:nitroimidazol reductase NimA-like FMN-containing flavoprotein (pyridoxamine 5'-phosphate oxidase superfamily)